uniref:Cytochrome c oxidase subunit n=1 Tax=Lactuca sativa TaxID=4236 RepID=A0A9R1X3G9_LACSA|nr:hypothetical protein LSAT_V11C700363020 [Lactuca sativa]
MAEIELKTAPGDYRFPTTNQSRHCFTRYVEFHRCVAAKGDDASECDKFAKFYRSLCPGEWVDRWNEQRENGYKITNLDWVLGHMLTPLALQPQHNLLSDNTQQKK